MLLILILAQSSTGNLLAADLPRVPPGFTVTRVTTPELVRHPTMACFDDNGRLYVCESAGTNAKAADLLKNPQDRIVRLEDADGDGVFDRSIVFADRLVFPQGVLWHEGVVYTCSSPYLWKLEDTDGDGVCDRRTVLVKSFGFSGNAADIHGPFLGPEGRLWWCDGRHGHEIRLDDKGLTGGPDNALEIPPKPEPGLPNPDGRLLSKGKAARIFNCKLDGSDVQTFCGGGMDNPVEIDFWETGEVLGTVNLFHGQPRGDCLVHWVWGGVYPRADQQDCIAEFPRTVGLLDEIVNYGHVAVSGMCRYRSEQLGRGWNQSVFITLFNTHKVIRTTLERSGSTFKATATEDFVVFDDPDSHPTDVLEDADGSLLVIDTGGWFRIGCPASKEAKPHIGGAIYRITPDSVQRPESPYALASSIEDLRVKEVYGLLRSGNQSVSSKALKELRRREAESRLDTKDLGFFESIGLRIAMASAVLLPALYGEIDDELARSEPMKELLKELVRGTYDARTRSQCELILRLSQSPVGQSLLNQHGINPTQWIMQSLRINPGDRIIEHTVIHAAIHIADAATLRKWLRSPVGRERLAALLALDQIPDAKLGANETIELLKFPDSDLQRTVLDVISRREGWSDGVVGLIGEWLNEPSLPDDRRQIIRRFLAARAADTAVQTFIQNQFARSDLAAESRLTLLAAIAEANVAEFPAAWLAGLRSALMAGPDAQRLGVAAARSHRIPELTEDLSRLVDDGGSPLGIRLAAMDVLHVHDRTPLGAGRFELLIAQVQSEQDPVLRATAARLLADSPLSNEQRRGVVPLLTADHAVVAPTLLRAFSACDDPSLAKALVSQLEASGDSLSLPPPELNRVFSKSPPAVQAVVASFLSLRGVDPARQAARLAELTEATRKGNAKAGREVFFSSKALCSRCHRVNGQGEMIGPDLSMVGAIRQHHELVEAVVDPSASFVRSYRPVILATTDGRTHSGVIAGETSTDITLRTAEFAEVRIRRDEIESFRESDVSIMPAGVDQRLTRTELADLIAFLGSLKERK